MSRPPHLLLVGNFNPNFEEWEDVREASPDELRAAVLPLIDYEAAAKEANRLLKIAFPWPWEGNGVPRFAKDIVNAALGLKETPE